MTIHSMPSPDETINLSDARAAYAAALDALQAQLGQPPPVPRVVDPEAEHWGRVLWRLLWLPGRVTLIVGRELRDDAGDMLGRFKGWLVRVTEAEPTVLGGKAVAQREQMRTALLNALWARDYVQDAIEQRNGAPYADKRDVLAFVMDSEERLARAGQSALEEGALDMAGLRDSQPTPPPQARWWWYLNVSRARRARRLSVLWFVLSLVPGLASVVLVTLLAQRLAIDGPDLLSGASVVAQVGLGVASIIAGREILNDLLLQGATASRQGQLVFILASLFLVVVVLFYYLAPPGAALVYNVFGTQAIESGNAAEAELYLESAARLDPDPHAASLLEVGCLYQTLGAPERARTVFERVLEADSRLLLARYHLAELYSDRGDYDQALQLLEDGLNLLETAREDLAEGQTDFLPSISTDAKADEIEYLLRLARGRAYLESGAPEQAQSNLRDAEDQFSGITARLEADGGLASLGTIDRLDLACGPDDDRTPFIFNTELNLHFHLARTYDALCDNETTVQAAQTEWRIVRNGRPSNSRQEAWRDEAVRRLSSGETCESNYGLAGFLETIGRVPARR